MEYFEINEPYFAIIAATDKAECVECYKKRVTDVEDEEDFFSSIESLEMATVINKLAKTYGEDSPKVPIGIEEAKKQIFECDRSNESIVLAFDGSSI